MIFSLYHCEQSELSLRGEAKAILQSCLTTSIFYNKLNISSEKSFTLVELLIVIAILAILAAVVIIVLNPSEFLKQARDSRRIDELQTINKTIGQYLADGGTSLGSSNTVYVFIPDSSPTCANLGLPTLPSGWSYTCSNSDNYRKIDGSG